MAKPFSCQWTTKVGNKADQVQCQNQCQFCRMQAVRRLMRASDAWKEDQSKQLVLFGREVA